MNKAAIVTFFLIFATFVACYDFYGPDWQKLSAGEKQKRLSVAILENSKPLNWYNALELLEIFVESHEHTMGKDQQDQMPKQGPFDAFTRKKLIHTVGAICKAKWVPLPNPYTGVFQGSDYAFLRFSTATAYTEAPFSFVPAAVVKFLRTGVKSANIFNMFTLEGQQGFNIFENVLSNHVPELSSNASAALRALTENFKKVSKWPTMVGTSDMASYSQNGTKVDKPVFPFQLFLTPTAEARKLFPSAYQGQVFLEQLKSVKVDTLYTVSAKASPKSPRADIAQIKLTGACTTSRFADETMFFEHQKMDVDFGLRPDWLKDLEQSE